jgi:hypothetical protein
MSETQQPTPIPPIPFNDSDRKEFHQSDIAATKAIVVMMTCIFVLGLLLYIGVALWVSG